MVLTRFALDFPDEIFDFFVSNNIHDIAFNIDELDKLGGKSSFQNSDAIDKYKYFMRRFLSLMRANPGKLLVREFNALLPFFIDKKADMGEGDGFNNTNIPLQMLTIDYLGNYCTFCPELLSASTERFPTFHMGNVATQSIDEIFENKVFQVVNNEVQAGVKLCHQSCEYWAFCGGGSPSNKIFETGRFDISETKYCQTHVQALTDVIVEHLEDVFVPVESIK
jgi:uncharacterized protein